MNGYYPLELKSKFKHNNYGYLPSKKFKRNLITKSTNSVAMNTSIVSLELILNKVYSNLKDHKNTNNGHCPSILKLVTKIIPMEYFGSSSNQKKFLFLVKRMLTQSRGEYIHLYALFEPFHNTAFLWINREQDIQNQVLQANILLLQTVVKPLINYFYHFVNTFRTRQFHVVCKGKMDSFIDRNLDLKVKSSHMEKVPISMKQPRSIGRLFFLPKRTVSELIHRPLVRSFKNNSPTLGPLRCNLKKLIKKFQIGTESELFKKWKTFVEHANKRKKIFAIKLDLLDAFGFIDLDILKTIIKNDQTYLTPQQKNFLIETISRQYITTRGHIYQWYHGLLQGAKLSPTLCELYLSYLTYTQMSKFDKPNCFFHRTVDDMFFASTSELDVNDFELMAIKMSLLNDDKTQMYSTEGGNPQIVFCGRIFNLETKETGTAYDFKLGKELRGNFKFWNKKKQFNAMDAYKFIASSMEFAYVNFHFSRFELNTIYNTMETVIKNIFHAMCYLGYKLFYAVESVEYLFKSIKERCQTTMRVVDFITSSYTPIILGTIRKFKGEKYKMVFSPNLIKYLCYRAFILVFQRRHFKYKILISNMKNKELFIAKLKEHIDIRYFRVLPLTFAHVKMRRFVHTDKGTKS